MNRVALPEQRIVVYQAGHELEGVERLAIEGALSCPWTRNRFFHDNAIVYKGDIYRGRGDRLSGVKTLKLLHGYGDGYDGRKVNDDFHAIAAALDVLAYDLRKPVLFILTSNHEKGFKCLNQEFDEYRQFWKLPMQDLGRVA